MEQQPRKVNPPCDLAVGCFSALTKPNKLWGGSPARDAGHKCIVIISDTGEKP